MSALALTLGSVYSEECLLFSLVPGISSAKEGSGREFNMDGWWMSTRLENKILK